jgi:ribose transport system ATP-binding protein
MGTQNGMLATSRNEASGSVLTPLLTISGLAKSYGGRRVLDGFGINLHSGELRALVGVNGSGKSTFVKILAGIVPADHPPEGFEIDGVSVEYPYSPANARGLGLRFVHQDLALMPRSPIFENLVWGRRPRTRLGGLRFDTRAEIDAARVVMEQLGLKHDPRALVGGLSRSEQTLVAIGRALVQVDETDIVKVLILDEPTVGLPPREVARVIDAAREVASSDAAVMIISHSAEDIENSDSLTVLRDGRVVAEGRPVEFDRAALLGALAGGLDNLPSQVTVRREIERAQPRLIVRGLRTTESTALRSIDFECRPSEVIGFCGDQNSGVLSLLPALFGDVAAEWDEYKVDEASISAVTPKTARACGLYYVPGDRTASCFPLLTVAENIIGREVLEVSARGRVNRKAEKARVQELIEMFGIQPPVPDLTIDMLSGGNQQRVVLARAFRTTATVQLLNEPTQGLDFMAREQIAEHIIREATVKETAFLIASTDEEWLCTVCTAVYAVHSGKIVEKIDGKVLSLGTLRRATLIGSSSLDGNNEGLPA